VLDALRVAAGDLAGTDGHDLKLSFSSSYHFRLLSAIKIADADSVL
jgi:hypothetical protein